MSTQAPPPPDSQTSPSQPLTPSFCLNTRALRDFLRLSRATIDDSISAHLNSLLVPSQRPFAFSVPLSNTPSGRARNSIPGESCTAFKERVLFPSWESRESVLVFCGGVADGSDSAPTSVSAGTFVAASASAPTFTPVESSPTFNATDAAHSPSCPNQKTNKNYWGEQINVDERTDPYSARDYSYTRATLRDTLRDVLAQEVVVERIVRARSWGVLSERCIGGYEGVGSLEGEWGEWRRKNGLAR